MLLDAACRSTQRAKSPDEFLEGIRRSYPGAVASMVEAAMSKPAFTIAIVSDLFASVSVHARKLRAPWHTPRV